MEANATLSLWSFPYMEENIIALTNWKMSRFIITEDTLLISLQGLHDFLVPVLVYFAVYGKDFDVGLHYCSAI